MSGVRADKRKETPFKCGRLAESLMGKLTEDVLEFFRRSGALRSV